MKNSYDLISTVSFSLIVISSTSASIWHYILRERRKRISDACREILIRLDSLNATITDYKQFRNLKESNKENEDGKSNLYLYIIEERYKITKLAVGEIKDDLLSRLLKTELKNILKMK